MRFSRYLSLIPVHPLRTRCHVQRRPLSNSSGGGPAPAAAAADYYKILGVDPTASEKELKAGFYNQSKKLHPDAHPDDENAPEKFRELVAAYEVLSDPNKRKTYDKMLQKPPIHQWTPHHHGQHSPPRNQYGVDPSIMRNIEVDLSEERMKKAWQAYRERWIREEENRRNLEEKKLLFRLQLDQRRAAYSSMTEDEKETMKENMRLFRHPDFLKKPLHSANSQAGGADEKERFSNVFDSMSRTNPAPNVFKDFENNEELRREIHERLKKDPEYKSEIEFWQNMATKYRQERMDQSNSNTSYQSKSTTGQFFEEVSKRGQDLRKQWTEAKPFEAGGPEEAVKRGVRPITEIKMSKRFLGFCLSFLSLSFGSYILVDWSYDPEEANVYLKKLKEERRAKQEEGLK